MINMNQPIEFKAAISAITKPTSQSSVVPRCRIIALLLVCFGLLPMNAFGVVPAPDGGYPGGNTAEGDGALFHLTTGVDNTAIGDFALFNNTTANDNTAIGFAALISNETGSNNTASGMNALFSNDSGHENTATGAVALFSNTN